MVTRQNTSSRTYEYGRSKTQQLQNLSRSSRTFEYLISTSSHNAYATLLHTSTAREAGIASPQTTEEAPAGKYFMQSPAATEVETASSPWPEEEAQTGFPGGLHAVNQQSPTEGQSKQTALTIWERDQMEVKPILMNIQSNEHFV